MVMQSESEHSLVAQAKNGDQRAFELLVRLHEESVQKVVVAMLGNVPEAQDVAQEVFIRWYQAMDRFEGRSGLRTYLTRIAINLSLNEIKRRKQKSGWMVVDNKHEVASHDFADDGTVHRNWEINDLLQKAMELLAPEFRIVLVLRLVEGYSVQETSDMLQIPEGTVASRLARAQIKLRAWISKLDQ